MQNEPNFNLAEIGVSYYLTSKYEDFMPFAASKNEPKRSQFIRDAYCVLRIEKILAHGIAIGYSKKFFENYIISHRQEAALRRNITRRKKQFAETRKFL